MQGVMPMRGIKPPDCDDVLITILLGAAWVGNAHNGTPCNVVIDDDGNKLKNVD